MGRNTLPMLVFLAAVGCAEAQAKLISASLPPPDESAQMALHRPTGCRAQIVLSYDVFIKGQITDPACLPKGVTVRDVPGTLVDFLITPQ
jgi:hypothetical protein